MLKSGPLVALCLLGLQGCGAKLSQCHGAGGCVPAGGDSIVCTPASSCNMVTPGSQTGVGVIATLPSSQCNHPNGPLELSPAPYFTTRTPDFSQPTIPHQCQLFNVVWNVCNSGTATSAKTMYHVTFLDDAPPGNDHGVMSDTGYSVDPLAPCACHSENQSLDLYCNDPTFTATTTHIAATLPNDNGNPSATGAFTTFTP